MPFADWKIRKTETLWVRSELPPFNNNYFFTSTSSLPESVFDNYARNEELETLIDNINLLYVAFTRPQTVLKIFYNTEAGKNSSSRWITEFVNEYGKNNIFEKGHLIKLLSQDNKTGNNTYKINFNESFYNKSIFNLLIVKPDHGKKQIKGETLHEILRHIKTQTDVEKIITQQNSLTPENRIIIRDFFNEGFKNEMFTEWFSNKWSIYNERNIIDNEGHVIRPDRLLIKDKTAIVIDFKTGKPHPDYHKEILIYAETVKQLGFDTVNGYLVYLYPFKIEQVTYLKSAKKF
jgi:ATP-dependent exoDNAse (exonuclease V) beta subunit